jgi:hypothetical protein
LFERFERIRPYSFWVRVEDGSCAAAKQRQAIFFWRLREEEAVLLNAKSSFFPYRASGLRLRASVAGVSGTILVIALIIACWAVPVTGQKASQDSAIMPKYDLKTETKTKGIVDEVKILPLGSRKDLREVILKSGEEKIYIYVCPQTFEEEMGISFNKGDEVAVTGSKVKQEDLDVILARELVKGTDTLVFRDAKGNPVWDPRTGK